MKQSAAQATNRRHSEAKNHNKNTSLLIPNSGRRNSNSQRRGLSITERETSAINFPLYNGPGLKYEAIVRCFISQHVMNFCETLCWKTWVEANSESSQELDEENENCDQFERPSVDELFKVKMDKAINSMKPKAEETFAAVVMADVSGYSNLSSTLAEKGAEGAEILSKTMKGYLDKIIGIILGHGGDIVKFAGDAVIFYWKLPKFDPGGDAQTSDDNLRGEIVLKAAHCCLDLLKLLGSYEVQIPELGSKILRIHLGIGAGNVYDVMVGGVDRWEHFIGGDAVNQLAAVLDLAKAGELALSHQALKCFSSIVDIASVGIGSYDKRCIILTGLEAAKRKNKHNAYQPKLNTSNSEESTVGLSKRRDTVKSDLSDGDKNSSPGAFTGNILPDNVQQAAVEMYKLFVNPAALYKLQTDINQSKLFRVDAGLTDLMSLRESRQITTIFIRVGSLTKWDSDATLLIAQEAMTIVQEALRKYEGFLRQALVDDKGATILVFFGLPPLSHENDANYGINAGLEIWEKMSNLMEDFSIGITTGMVSIGGVGNESRMGDAINMAARLMCSPKAKQIILCDEKTFSLCENEFVFENLGLLKVKGKAHPINIYQPKHAKAIIKKSEDTAESKVLIGREKERNIIEQAIKIHLTTIGPRSIIMEAESGMGLSSMANWTDNKADTEGLIVLSGRNSAQTEKTTRYYVWQEIVKDLMEAIEAMPEPQNKTKQPNEDRAPMFLMTSKDDKERSDKSKGSSKESSDKKSNSRSQMSSQVGKKILKPPRKGESSLGTKSNEKKKDVMSSTTSAMANKKKVAIVRNRQYIGGSVDEKAPPLVHSGSQDMGKMQPTTAAMKKWIALEERLRKAFAKVGEAMAQTALMNLVYPFEFTQNEVYGKLQGKFRINELTDLLRRLVNDLAEWKPVLISIHDSQWIDQLSWELLWELSMSCPKLMICIFSRPEKYHESIETRMQYQKFKKHNNAEFIKLEGLNSAEVEELIVQNWPSSSVKVMSVSKNIVENIQKRTSGNPLYIKSAIVALKESGKFSVLPATGELSLSAKEFDFEKSISLVDNLQTVITSQLDRLDASFQLFLKVASVLGQPFLLEDALNLLQDTPMFSELAASLESALEGIIAKIKAMDKYEYLEHIDNVSVGAQFQFKSSLVKECIYTMMLQTQRQLLHLNVATYYERIIDAQNQQRLLLALYEHYSNADESHTMKKLTYLEIMAHLYFERNSMGEAIKHLTMLIEGVENPPKNVQITFDNISKASWHRELGEAYYNRGDAMRAEKHLLESLKLNSYKFPSGWISLSIKTSRELKIRSKWPILLAGDADLTSGISQMPDPAGDANYSSHESVSMSGFDAAKNIITEEMQFDPMAVLLAEMILDKEYAKLHNIRRAMTCLGMMYLNTGKYKEAIYAVNVATNISELFPRDALYAKLMAICGLLSWTEQARKRDTLRYLESASKHDQRFDLVQTVSIVLKSAQTFFLMGKWGSAIRRLGLLPALEMMSGDFLLRLDALRMRSVIIHLCGARPQSLKAARALFVISTQEDNWEGKLWGCELILANYLNIVKTSAEVPEYGRQLKALWEKKPDRLKDDPTLNLNFVALSARADLRSDPANFSVDNFLKHMSKITTDLLKPPPKKFSENSFSARGGECNSAGGPHECLALIGVLHSASAFLMMWDAKLISKSSHSRSIIKICNDIKKWLLTGNLMKRMTIAEPIQLLYEGVALHITGRSGAVKSWKKGLAGRRVSDLMFVRGLLHLQIACYTDNPSNSNHNAHEAQKLFSRIGSTVEFERARAFRKDRKDRSKGDLGSQSEVKEMDDNCGDSIFDESKSYGDRSFGDQSSNNDD